MRPVYLKLRANIELDGDVTIAEREVNFFCENYFPVHQSDLEKVKKLIELSENNILSNTRKNGVIGFVGYTENELDAIIIKSSFIQEIWTDELLETENELVKKAYCEMIDDGNYCIIPLFPMGEFLTYYHKSEVQHSDIKLFTLHLSNKEKKAEIEKVVFKSSTSTPHSHGLHKYKAKFFPRLIRNILVTECNNKKDVLVLDPFVGSGTTLIESAFMGFKSIGVDIDKLSCLISESKVNLLKIDHLTLLKETEVYQHAKVSIPRLYRFPSWISKKFDRWGTVAERDVYEKDVSSLTANIESLNDARKLFQTIISDAVSRKFNIRMMGTGVGRFALEIQKSSLSKIVQNNIKFLIKASSVVKALISAYDINIDLPEVINGNATSLGLADETVDIILTSPPYLPASSGRENYLIGKSISITALDLMTENEIELAEEGSVGSMKNQTEIFENGLPNKVYELYTFLKNDSLRNIKAEPTYTYYQDIKKSLAESYRVLKRNGKAIYVIGKESVFYTFKTREILYKVECDSIFSEIAKDIGFKIKEVVNVELNKKNKNARPRALDKYYESVFILEKP